MDYPKKLQVITYPQDEKILRQKSKKLAPDEDLGEFVDRLKEKMLEADGVGLAAIQVGIPARMIAIKTEEGPQVFINPEITWCSDEEESDVEACLSVPGVSGLVRRPQRIKITAQDENRKTLRLSPTGFLARVFQHEIDHTNGILFIDKAERILE